MLETLSHLVANEDKTRVRREVRRLVLRRGLRRGDVLEILNLSQQPPWKSDNALVRALAEHEVFYLQKGRGRNVNVLKQAIAELPYPSQDTAQLLSRIVLHDNRTQGRM